MALSTARVRLRTASFDRILEVMDGGVGVEWRAPKAGALAEGCVASFAKIFVPADDARNVQLGKGSRILVHSWCTVDCK